MSQFRLAAVERMRFISRDERRLRLAEARRAEDQAAHEVAALNEELAALRSGMTAVAGRLDVAKLREADAYARLLTAQRTAAIQRQQSLAAAAEARRRELVAADCEVKAVEKLRQNHDAQVRADRAHREIKSLDEAVRRSMRISGHST